MDNRISRYRMKRGEGDITGIFLYDSDVFCHQYMPKHLGGNDPNHLRILHIEVHTLIRQKESSLHGC